MNVGNYPCKAPSPGRGGVARGGWSSPSCELELVFSENQQRRPNPRVLAGDGGEDVIMVLSLDYEPRTVDTVTTTGRSQS